MADRDADTAIDIENLSFRWRRQDRSVLDIPSFRVRTGERLFLRGPSGAGKSTLLNLIGGLATAGTGRVEVMGQNLAGLPRRRRDRFRADRIGFVFQMFNLAPYLSLIDNVTLPCRFSALRRRCALAQSDSLEAEATRLLERMRLDVADLRARPVATLSQGQQQRVAAARALIGRPGLVVADEPTSAIDDDARDAYLDLLLEEVAAAEATLVFVSHDRRIGERFDRVVELSEINRAGV